MMLNRLLYIYAVTHPASGYVQGMTDLVIPFLSAFLRPYLGKEISEVSCLFMNYYFSHKNITRYILVFELFSSYKIITYNYHTYNYYNYYN